ncbi:MAG TPA: hypothetical protein VFZ65_07300 [Planctomycetota bacterium]|nr:hypothetical protein [Planctomycetota bacterium]
MIVLGCGGRAFWQQYASRCGNPTCSDAAQRQFARRGVRGVAAVLRAAEAPIRVVESGCGRRLSLARLAEAAGFGIVSPVSGFLLHPEFGPWVSLHAALLFDGQPFGLIPDASITDRFHPCCTCARPCVSNGPVAAGDAKPVSGPCPAHGDASCGSRSFCPIGAEHRDHPGEAVHCQGAPAAGRWRGIDLSRLFARFLRR